MRVYHDKRTGWWIMDYLDTHGIRCREKAARTKTLAKLVLGKRLDEVAQEKAGLKPATADMTVQQLWDRFQVWAYTHKRPKTALRYKISWKALLPRFGKLPLAAVTTEAVEKFQSERLLMRKPATVNRDVATFKRMFSKAVEWNYASDNPLRRVKLLRENNTRIRYLTNEERGALLSECHGYLLDMVMVALNTGMRLSEILNLKWADLDFSRRQIAVRQTKNGHPRFVPMPQPLITHLREVPRQVGCPYLWTGHDGNPFTNISTSWDSALDRAKVENFRFHDLRHTFASYFVMAGGDLNTLREILGHRSMAMTLRYAHLAPEHLHAGVDQMARKMADGTLFPKEDGTYVAQEKKAV